MQHAQCAFFLPGFSQGNSDLQIFEGLVAIESRFLGQSEGAFTQTVSMYFAGASTHGAHHDVGQGNAHVDAVAIGFDVGDADGRFRGAGGKRRRP